MGRKFYTIMVVPHATAKFRRLKISKRFLILSGTFLGLLLIGGLMLPHFLLESSRLRASVRHLMSENSDLKNV
ncbi:MAG: hypothetical protein O7A63_04860, partial [Acidobacteria bacterium]|nr:hypothetical protein [Acidobacteriota bacterium]